MRKSLFSLVVILAITFTLVAAPPAAQAAGFQPMQFLTSLKDRIANGAERLYLRVIPGDKDGQAVLKQTTMAMEKVTSLQMDATADIDVKQGDQSMGTAKISITGPTQVTDVHDPSTVKDDLTVKGEFKVEGVQLSGAAEMIIDGTNAYYYKVTEIPLPLQQYAKLKNQWIKVDPSKLNKDNKPAYDAETLRKYQDAEMKLLKSATISKARKDKWNDKQVFVVDAEFGKDALMTYFNDIEAITNDQIKDETAKMTDKDKEQVSKAIDALAPVKGTMWIDRGTFYVSHVELPLTINIKDFSEKVLGRKLTAQEMGPTMPDQVDIKLSMSFDKFNEPVTITIPSDARPAAEVMQEMMGGYMGGSGMGTPSYPSYGSGYGSTNPTYPVQELPNLTPAQQMQLKQYGYNY